MVLYKEQEKTKQLNLLDKRAKYRKKGNDSSVIEKRNIKNGKS